MKEVFLYAHMYIFCIQCIPNESGKRLGVINTYTNMYITSYVISVSVWDVGYLLGTKKGFPNLGSCPRRFLESLFICVNEDLGTSSTLRHFPGQFSNKRHSVSKVRMQSVRKRNT